MTTKVDVAAVNGPGLEVRKARATFTADDTAVVKDRKTGKVLVVLTGCTFVAPGIWECNDGMTLRKQNACGCGGTKVRQWDV